MSSTNYFASPSSQIRLTMQTNIQTFTSDIFGVIRTCQVNNQIMFVGKDVATALGYSKPLNAISMHVDEDDSLKWGLMDSMGRKQQAIFINESGLYSLILSSKLPQAKAFKRWVTSEVLPQIRMTGGYIPTKDADGTCSRRRKSWSVLTKSSAARCCC